MSSDYTTKGRDFDTELVQDITDDIIDADRLCRVERDNGFPNFAIYRLILAGDRSYFLPVRHWWVMFSIEWCRSHMRGGFSEELATVAAWDSLRAVMEPNADPIAADGLAQDLGVSAPTYRRVRNALQSILSAALHDYWGMIGAMYRIVVMRNRYVS